MGIPGLSPGGPPNAPEGLDWALLADARIINPPSIAGYVPVLLTLTATLPLQSATNEATLGLATVMAFSAPATPGYYEVMARASTTPQVPSRGMSRMFAASPTRPEISVIGGSSRVRSV